MLPIADLQSAKGFRQVATSLQTSGFAVMVGHGIEARDFQQLYESWNQFFTKADKKSFTADSTSQSGYFSIQNAERAVAAKEQDLKEYFQFWPGTTIPTPQKQLTLQIYDQMFDIAQRILTALQDHLPASTWTRLESPLAECLSREDTMIRLLYYPPLSGNEPADAMRAAPHEDINFITLLPAASQQGLEIKPKQSDWQQVETSSDSIVVNIGDMLKELTDHKLPSTTHRVVNPAKEARQMARISAPLFCHPDPSLRLSPEYTAGDYLRDRINEINAQTMKIN